MIIDNSLNIAKSKLEKISNDTKIITLDLESHNKLNNLKKINEKIDNYLTNDDRNFIDNTSLKISTEWYKNPKISELLKFDELNLGSLFEQEISIYLLKKIRLFLVLIRLINNESSKTISASVDVKKQAIILFLV